MNNLKKIIKAKGMTQLEFGKKIFPELEHEPKMQKQNVLNRVGRVLRNDFALIHKCQKALDCSFNEIFEDETENS